MQGTVVGIWNIAGNESDKRLAFMEDYQKSTIEFISLAEGSGSYTQASCFLEWD